MPRTDIEKSFSVIRRAVNGPTAPFFRFPYLRHSPETLKYLADRNVAVFSTDIDSFDFKGGKSDALVKRIMAGLEKRGKGIILMHDIQPHTAAAMPALLKQLKAGGYKVVHMTAKAPISDAARVRRADRQGHAGHADRPVGPSFEFRRENDQRSIIRRMALVDRAWASGFGAAQSR